MPRRVREKKERKQKQKFCQTCGAETRWLSVDNNCWDCTVRAIKNKKLPLPPRDILPEDPEDDGEL